MKYINIRWVRVIVLVFLLFYFVGGVTARLLMQNEEQVYLLYSWDLYAKVPLPEQEEFSVLIDSIEGKTFSPPLFINGTHGLLYSESIQYEHTLVHAVDDLGDAVIQGDTAAVEKARVQIERTFLHAPVVYEIVFIRYNPIERWKTGTLTSILHLAKFVSTNHE